MTTTARTYRRLGWANLNAVPAVKAYTDADFKAIETVERRTDLLRAQVWSDMDKAFSHMERAVLNRLDASVLRSTDSNITKAPEDLFPSAEELYSESEWGNEVGTVLAPSMHDAYVVGYGYGYEFNDIPDDGGKAAAWARIAAGVAATYITATTLRAIARRIAQARAQRDPIDSLKSGLRRVFQDSRDARSEAISTTEITSSINTGAFDAFSAQFVPSKRWITRHDERVDKGDAFGPCWSNERDGPIPLEEAFSSGHMMPGAHPRCRCLLRPSFVIIRDRTPFPRSEPIPDEEWNVYEDVDSELEYERLGDFPISVASRQITGTLTTEQLETIARSVPPSHLVAAHPNTSVPPGMSISPNRAGLRIHLVDELSDPVAGLRRVAEYRPERDLIVLDTSHTPPLLARLLGRPRSLTEIQATFRHEIGHRVQTVFFLERDPEWSRIAKKYMQMDLRDLHQHFHYPRLAAERIDLATGVDELFAQVYDLYLSDRRALQRVAPDLYAYMRQRVFLIEDRGKRLSAIWQRVVKHITPGHGSGDQQVHAGDIRIAHSFTLAEAKEAREWGMLVTNPNIIERGGAYNALKVPPAQETARRLKGDRHFEALVPAILDAPQLGQLQKGSWSVTDRELLRNDPHTAAMYRLQKVWDYQSPHTTGLHAAIQFAAEREFSVLGAATEHLKHLPQSKEWMDIYGEGLQKVWRAKHEQTQEYLKKNGVTDLLLYRGLTHAPTQARSIGEFRFNGRPYQDAFHREQPLASFSADPTTALRHAYNKPGNHLSILATKIPARHIIALPETGIGKAPEFEAVVQGGLKNVSIVRWMRTLTGSLFPSLGDDAQRMLAEQD